MKVIDSAIKFPTSTAVGVLLLVLFGTLALFQIPVQLTPEVQDPNITVTTIWPGASPQEIEREIVDEQEEQLKSLEGLLEMESTSSDSQGTITLTFPVGTDIDAALLRVSNRLQQVPSYPSDAEKPIITSVGFAENAVAWFMLVPTEENGYDGDISTLYDFMDETVKPALERVPGIGLANIFGGRERELQVIVDPAKLAARRIGWTELGSALERENRNYSGGDFDEGKRRYVVRTIGEYASPSEVENIVVAVRDGVPVYVRDVARAEIGFRKPAAKVFTRGQQVIAINAIRETGSNVLEVMEGLRDAVDRLNNDLLGARGLRLVQVYDETEYVESAITLVQQSLVVGGILAIVVLLLYLRSGSSTLVIAVAIPISVIGTFLMMYAFGRTVNVISLAGMAFAVGMVVDNSIVVLENIYRHRQMGKPLFSAAYDGAREVWGAVLASTLTTIAVFVPVIFIQEEVGQLFGDIALAISCAVALSLVVSITVIPSLSARILRTATSNRRAPGRFGRLLSKAGRFADLVSGMVAWINASIPRRLAIVSGFLIVAVGGSLLLMPKTEYLPVGNNNFLFGIMLPPPGYNLDEVSALRSLYEQDLKALWESEPGSPEARQQPGGGIGGFFFVTLHNQAFIGVRARDPLRTRELIPLMMSLNQKLPGAIVVVNQRSIFERGFDEGRNIDIDVTGPDLQKLMALGGSIFMKTMQVLPGAQGRPIPGLDLDNPEIRVVTHRRRAAELGLSNRELGFAVSALVDGAKASDYQLDGREIDLKVVGEGHGERRTHRLAELPIATPAGELVTLGSVAEVEEVNGPVQINHRERERAVTLRITPAETMPLEQAMEILDAEVFEPLRRDGELGGLYRVRLSGTADKLSQAATTLKWDFLLAIVITYLLMSALFESFLYPLVIMVSVPLAAFGGILGLAAVNLFTLQALDVLTMLGFIILVGTVVNNAILIVHQSLNHMREESMSPEDAIREAVRNRIRPIFMSVSTSVFGMLPLVLFPGAGSELYRGLGSVVVGGLVVSTLFTLILVPALFSLALDARSFLASRFSGWLRPAESR
ncbi:MAG TPA: efflux RND transporter permease subunit [Vicinamibacteria bacterium]|nr:efflux RND transporter permease subunit [Vicinamibacteria bacterium]